MRFFRNIIFQRILVGLTLFGVGSVVYMPEVQAETAGMRYADWLRLHIPGGTEPVIQEALERAAGIGARSFDEFLLAFVEEVSTSDPDGIAADRIVGRSADKETLLKNLRLHFTDLIGESLMIRHFEMAPPARTDGLKKRSPRGDQVLDTGKMGPPDPVSVRTLESLAHRISSGLLRSSAQPLGP